MKFQSGDKVLVSTSDGDFEGVFLPSADLKTSVLKLDNGYNMVISKSKVKGMKLLKSAQKQEKKVQKLEGKKGLKTISILHTGGTIASKVDYSTGAVNAKFT